MCRNELSDRNVAFELVGEIQADDTRIKSGRFDNRKTTVADE
jgi:hypothetical protein